MKDYISERHDPIPNLNDLGFNTANPQEAGYPSPPSRPSKAGIPPGGGKQTIPHYVSFATLVNQYTRTYRYTFDEAQKHSHQYTVAIRNEPVVMEAIRALQMPISLLTYHIEPENPEDPFEEENAKGLEQIVRKIPKFQQYRRSLLEGVMYGRYANQNVFTWNYDSGVKNLLVRDWRPVNGDKLVFRYNGQVGVLVHATWNMGNTALTDRGRAYFLTPEERETFVIHEFEPEDSDFWEGDTAGAIHGVGIRGRIYWIYWLRAQVLGWLMEYLERVGAGGLTVYYYEHGNEDSLVEVQAAAEKQFANNAILFPRYRDGSTGGPGIERIDPSNAGAKLLEDLIFNYFDRLIRRYILGQTSEDSPQGLGSSSWADLVADSTSQRIKYHTVDLDETISGQLISVLNKYNCPWNPCPRFVSEVDRPNIEEYINGVQTFLEMGGDADKEAVRKVLALPRPIPGREVLGPPPAPEPQPGEAGPVKASRAVRRELARYRKKTFGNLYK